MAFTFEWRGEFRTEEVGRLHAEAFRHRVYPDADWDWRRLVDAHSLGWVVAREGPDLIGFVNVISDGLVHAWIQDTMVADRARRRGVGTRLITIAREAAREAGCEWLHVDFSDELAAFYLHACGFVPTGAGLIDLTGDPAGPRTSATPAGKWAPPPPASQAAAGLPRLYVEFSSWWPLLSDPADYAEEAAVYHRVLSEAARIPVRSVLELGSGGGNNASHLKADYAMTLVDLAPGMLAVSETLNPECEHIEGDMRTVRLGRSFDAVFVHDAVAYMASAADLAAVMATAYVHCLPGGAVLFVPDVVRETFEPSTDHGGYDGADRGLRYLEWTQDRDPADHEYEVDFAYLLRSVDGVTVAHDRHVCGLFGRDEWLAALEATGFTASTVRASLTTGESLEMFVGIRPGAH